MEEAAFLATVYRGIGGIKIQYQLGRRRLEGGNELFH